MRTLQTILATWLALLPLCLIAQIGPPSLTAGAGGLVYEKGQIDTELLASLIASKQAEVKSELAKRLILDRLECGSFTLWNYTRNNLDILFSGENSEVMTKEMLRYGAELALVYGLSEYYLNDLSRKSLNGTLNTQEKEFLIQYFRWCDGPALHEMIPHYFLPKDSLKSESDSTISISSLEDPNRYYESINYLIGTNIGDKIKLLQKLENDSLDEEEKKKLYARSEFQYNGEEAIKNYKKYQNENHEFLSRPILLPLLKNKHKDFRESKRFFLLEERKAGYCDKISPNHILIDLMYDVCNQNKYVQGMGFFQGHGIPDEAYQSRNKYLIFKKYDTKYDATYKQIDDLVTLLFKHYNSLKSISLQGITEPKAKNIAALADKALERKANAQTILKALNRTRNLHDSFELNEEDRQTLKNISLLITNASKTSQNKENLQYFLEEQILPQLTVLSTSGHGEFKDLLAELHNFRLVLEEENLTNLVATLSKVQVDGKDLIQDLSSYLQLVEAINELDNAETYDKIFKLIRDIGAIYSDTRVGHMLSTIANQMDRYLLIDKDNNELKLDVESIAVDVYKQYGQNNSARFNAYFTVGVTTAHRYNPKEMPEGEEANEPEDALSFASEKLGLNYKIINWNRRRSTMTGSYGNKTVRVQRRTARYNRKPFVSDLHATSYVSGLLYQIEALNTEEEFKKPLYGLSLGLRFFNGLDFNAGVAVPFETHPREGFVTLGFDIPITEYLSALGRKNK